MTPKPMIFGAESVRAILAGTKTQTRRVVKPQPEFCPDADWAGGGYLSFVRGKLALKPISVDASEFAPHPAGSRVWLREKWQQVHYVGGGQWETVHSPQEHSKAKLIHLADTPDGHYPPRWRSPIHMPRWASRITLEIVDVRVQRVQDISQADAYAEGVQDWEERQDPMTGEPCQVQLNPIEEYANLWDRINGARYPWASNPWVWCYSFRRIER